MGRSPIQQATEIKTEPKQLRRPKIMPLLDNVNQYAIVLSNIRR
jgi:hypothetical protein